jgi:hypothetical protein
MNYDDERIKLLIKVGITPFDRSNWERKLDRSDSFEYYQRLNAIDYAEEYISYWQDVPSAIKFLKMQIT